VDASETIWPLFVQDRDKRVIYLTRERWDHALEHPGMSEQLLPQVLTTLRTGRRKQDRLDPAKYFYRKAFAVLPFDHTHIVVVVKFERHSERHPAANNFVLTAYLVGGA